jgi:hypothetical protein
MDRPGVVRDGTPERERERERETHTHAERERQKWEVGVSNCYQTQLLTISRMVYSRFRMQA